MLQVKNIKKRYGEQEVIKDASFSINNSERIAIVGNNGAGKSTLINIIMGNLEYDGGELEYARENMRIGFMPQTIDELDLPMDMSIHDFIRTGRPIEEILEQQQETYEALAENPDDTGLMHDIERLDAEFDALGGYEAEAQLEKIIKGFNLDDIMLQKSLSEVSGGQKSKAAFIRALYAISDILILDEPTNHLDETTKEWVMDYLALQKIPVLTISHDEEFLNRVVNKTVFLNNMTKKSEVYFGNYKKFMKVMTEKNIQLEKQFENQQRKIKGMESSNQAVGSFVAKRIRQDKSRQKKIDKIKEGMIQKAEQDSDIKVRLTVNREEKRTPMTADGLCFSYDKKVKIIQNASCSIYLNERFVLVGENGAGKTTFLKLLAGKLTPDRGKIFKGSKTDIAYYTQEHEDIDLDSTLFDELQKVSDKSENEIRTLLGAFKFKGNKVFQEIRTLSPGERSRLALLKMCASGANLLLLDEPTNHLDMATKSVFAEFIKNYGGTVVIVCHEIDFLEKLGVERMLMLPSCEVKEYDRDVVSKLASE